MQEKKVYVTEEQAGERIDKFLTEIEEGALSRSFFAEDYKRWWGVGQWDSSKGTV